MGQSMTFADGRIDARDWLLLVGLSILWGGSFFLIGVVLKELPPLTLVLLRTLIAAIILLPLLRLSGIAFPKGLAGWMPFCAMSFFNNVLPFSLLAIGQTYIATGLASILNATTPMFTVLVMAAAGEERLIARRLAGVVAGLVGVVIIRGGIGTATEAQSVGIVLCLIATLSYAVSALVARRYLSELPAAGYGDISNDGIERNDDHRGRCRRAAVAPADAERDHVACSHRAGERVDGARLSRLFPDHTAVGRDQRHAGHTSDPGDRHYARISRPGREHIRA